MQSIRFSLALISLLLAGLLLVRCQPRTTAETHPDTDLSLAVLPERQPGEAVMTVAAGCFWSVQDEFNALRGVRSVVSGYAGGDLAYPAYEQVGTGQTHHAESVQIYYDPATIPFDTLLTAFFIVHDASSRNRQGPDVGTQYRSVAFYRTASEKAHILAAIRQQNQSGRYSRPLVTEVVPIRDFYPAELYHQGYYHRHPDELYVRTILQPKVEHFRQRMRQWLK